MRTVNPPGVLRRAWLQQAGACVRGDKAYLADASACAIRRVSVHEPTSCGGHLRYIPRLLLHRAPQQQLVLLQIPQRAAHQLALELQVAGQLLLLGSVG